MSTARLNLLTTIISVCLILLSLGAQAQAPTPQQEDENLRKQLELLRQEIKQAKKEVESLLEQRAQERYRTLRRREVEAKAKTRTQPTRSARRAARRQAIQLQYEAQQAKRHLGRERVLEVGPVVRATSIRVAKLEQLLPVNNAPTDQRQMILRLAVERDQLEQKIRRANERRMCRWFRLGCIGKK